VNCKSRYYGLLWLSGRFRKIVFVRCRKGLIGILGGSLVEKRGELGGVFKEGVLVRDGMYLEVMEREMMCIVRIVES
jgi:hypothetical protein